jgi:hypothetical protein
MITMLEKYETPEFEFVEMEDLDIITASGCDGWYYGNDCTAGLTA